MLDKNRPDHGVRAFADHRTRRHIDQDRAEQGECDSDAAENKIFPRRFKRRVGAIDADHQHRRQRGDFHGDPHQTNIVRDERKVHAEHHGLIHGVVEAQVYRGQPAGFEFMRDVAGAEDAGGEAHECVEYDKDDIQVVDQNVRAGLRTFDDEQR